MSNADTVAEVRKKFQTFGSLMDERTRRLWAACEAGALGRGGVTAVAEATGMSRTTIRAGIVELEDPKGPQEAEQSGPQRVRRAGAGRKRLSEHDKKLLRDLEALVEPSTRGDPQSPLRWTCKSTRHLADALVGRGHQVSYRTVAALLHDLDYSLQANRKTREGASHPDRNAQFEYINKKVRTFQKQKQPVVSVDTKKRVYPGFPTVVR